MTVFRVASYNIRKCIGLDRRRDPDRTLGVIAGLQADIVALQEADRRLPPRPSALPADTARRLGMEALDVDPSTPSIGFHGNALLIRGGFRVTRLRGIDLPGLEPRGAILAELARGDATLRVVATHLGLLRRYRQMQLEAIAAAVADGPRMPTMIMGDFNEWSETDGFGPLQGYRVISPGRTYHAARPVAPLDRIALTGGLQVVRSDVVSSGEALRASDHLPITAELAFRDGD
ncbi:endonuclease/exonuclease/phosphatase family protein [Palleronia sp. KMU-117]|uniref:endonuclease/exonuclease/phosphatase family protein n=1 Tax=Palleronia sp. KMU-117 TaxID=3434108 RepID=UPI003D763865